MARKKTTPTPFDIKVEADESRDDHCTIAIKPELNIDDHPEAVDKYTMAEFLAGYRWVAGIAARVGIMLTQDVDEAVHTHRCRRGVPDDWLVVCQVMGASEELVDPHDVGSSATVWIIIPSEDRKQWLKKVRETVQKIVTAEMWQPGEDDERAFRGEPGAKAALASEPTSHAYTDDGYGRGTCTCQLPARQPIHEAPTLVRDETAAHVESDVCVLCGAPLLLKLPGRETCERCRRTAQQRVAS